MKQIYILLMSSKTIPDRVIRSVTSYKYGHTALAMNKECKTLYSFGRRKATSILNGGFTVERQDGPFYTIFNETECTIYELDVTDEQYMTLNSLLDHMVYRMRTYNYDYLGIVLRYFHLPVSFKKKFVCSFFVARLLQVSGIYTFPKPDMYVKPADFEQIPGLREIYVGKYRDYKREAV